MTHQPDARDLRDLALKVAGDISAMLLREVDQGHSPDTKSSKSDYVTAVDREAERQIVQAITAVRPDDGFVGEEGAQRDGSSGVRWIIDPIDGTTNFVYGHPGFCVSIAAEIDGTVVAGVVADPIHDHVFDALLGDGARLNGDVINVRPAQDLSRAVVATGFNYQPERRTQQAQALVTIIPSIADIRRMGSAATDLCGVAYGRVDAYYEVGLNEWDLAAGALIASEAGARLRMPGLGGPDDDLIVAAAPGIAGELMELIATAGLP